MSERQPITLVTTLVATYVHYVPLCTKSDVIIIIIIIKYKQVVIFYCSLCHKIH